MAVTAAPDFNPHRSSRPVPSPGSGKFAEAVFLLLVPLLAFLALHFEPVEQNHMLDPYLYTGYIHNFQDLMARYGVTYYGVRFGLLFPARLSTALFGNQGGYLALRYALALVFGVPLYRVAKQYLGMPVAMAVYSIALSSPFLARALLWDHPDATGVPFLMASICLLLEDPDHGRWRPLLAGCCLGLAGNSNIFTVAIFGIFVAVLAGLWIVTKRPWRRLFRMMGLAAAASWMVCAAGALYYWRATGYLNIFEVTFEMATLLSRGGFATWREHGAGWTLAFYHVYLPVWLAICCLVLYGGAGRRHMAAAAMCWYGAAVTAFYFVHQFVLQADTLQLFYYFSYAAPAVFLMLALLYRRLWELAGVPDRVFVILAVAPAILPWVLISFGWNPLLRPLSPGALVSASAGTLPHPILLRQGLVVFAAAALLVTASFAVLRSRPRRQTPRAMVLATVILLGFGVDASLGYYSGVVRRWGAQDTSERDVYRVALQLIDAVPRYRSGDGILFWYDGRRSSPANSVQSMYLWGPSRLQSMDADSPGLPYLDAAELAKLRSPGVRYLGLLCESPAQMAQATDALRNAGLPYREAARRELTSGSYRLYWALLDLRAR
jgi:Dolichyl-phosphate-mannose-protein mannosyltransferase